MLNFELDEAVVCRDDRCDLVELHRIHDIGRRLHRHVARTKSRRWRMQPWRANCTDALRESVHRGVSLVEPRNFATVLSYVENDYGSCCPRSVHRHLAQLRCERAIIRMEFRGNVHAYLLAGSRLIADPELVHEQVTMLYGEVA